MSVLLIRPQNRDYWQLPKGGIDPGESAPETAVREVREETGVLAEIITDLAPITFFYQSKGRRFVKTVDFFLMEYQSGSTADHDHEVAQACWFDAKEAIATLTFESERNVLRTALQYLDGAYATAAG